MNVHLCALRCKIRCALGHHTRLDPEGQCRCCRRIDHTGAQAQARRRDWSKLTTGWWKELKE